MSVIPINARGTLSRQRAAVQPGACAKHRIPHDNQHTRRSFVRMFLCGATVRTIASRTGASERAVEQEIREALITGSYPGEPRRAAA